MSAITTTSTTNGCITLPCLGGIDVSEITCEPITAERGFHYHEDLRISFVAPSGKTESITLTNEDALRLAEIITEAVAECGAAEQERFSSQREATAGQTQ